MTLRVHVHRDADPALVEGLHHDADRVRSGRHLRLPLDGLRLVAVSRRSTSLYAAEGTKFNSVA
ncbi:hypothetical protein [Streptomyces sp. NPDC018833]|uniref:hypothetical protein n=1 Tax=Streptomyces sp. NPDC018833 TaxID=3365053 RepID=UPI0037913A09